MPDETGPEEAAAMALAKNAAMNTHSWEQMPEYLRDGYRRAAAAALDAVRPLLLSAVLAEVAWRIEAEGRFDVEFLAEHATDSIDRARMIGAEDAYKAALRVVAAYRSERSS